MNVKHALKLTFCGLFMTLLAVPAVALNQKDFLANDYLEPQFIVPEKDTAFLQNIRMNVDLSKEPIVNIMFLAQDKRAPMARAKLTTTRSNLEVTPALASRSDIINIISMNRATGKWTIYAFYRGMMTPSVCGGSIPAEENYLTNYYAEYGRRYMIPCLEHIMQTGLNRHARLAEIHGGNGRSFKIHAFIEGTKEETLNGLATAILKTASWNSLYLLSIYGRNGLSSALSMITNKKQLAKATSGQEKTEAEIKEIGAAETKYIYVEAKERYTYAAGGYQRSFNFARILADALGWIGYGVNADPEITDVFAHIFDRFFSRTFSLKDFVLATKLENGKSALANAAYANGMSPVTIVQFGTNTSGYSVFQNDDFNHYGSGTGELRKLDPKIQILKRPLDRSVVN